MTPSRYTFRINGQPVEARLTPEAEARPITQADMSAHPLMADRTRTRQFPVTGAEQPDRDLIDRTAMAEVQLAMARQLGKARELGYHVGFEDGQRSSASGNMPSDIENHLRSRITTLETELKVTRQELGHLRELARYHLTTARESLKEHGRHLGDALAAFDIDGTGEKLC